MQYPLTAPGVNLYNGKFSNGDPLNGIARSIDRAEDMNRVYDELIAVVAAAGLTPSEADNTQVLQAMRFFSVPAGGVIFVAQSTPPNGYLKANGATISRATYAALFNAIGTTYGAGDGSTTFRLPDLRGEFLRAWDDGRGVDTGRVLGSAQAGAIQSHVHTNGFSAQVQAAGGGLNFWAGLPTIDTGATGGTETRPRNIALLACIKF